MYVNHFEFALKRTKACCTIQPLTHLTRLSDFLGQVAVYGMMFYFFQNHMLHTLIELPLYNVFLTLGVDFDVLIHES